MAAKRQRMMGAWADFVEPKGFGKGKGGVGDRASGLGSAEANIGKGKGGKMGYGSTEIITVTPMDLLIVAEPEDVSGSPAPEEHVPLPEDMP